jgi:membrane protein required for colicin V production
MQLPALTAFNAFDWFLFVILALSTLLAFMRGFIRAFFGLIGFIVGIVVASWNFPLVASHFTGFVTSVATAEILAFVFILIVVVLLFHLISTILYRTIAAIGLGFVDRFLGAIFGFFRGCLFGVAAMMAMAAFTPQSPWIKHSVLAPYFLSGAHAVSFVVPDHFQARISEGASHLLHQTPALSKPDSLKVHTLRPSE